MKLIPSVLGGASLLGAMMTISTVVNGSPDSPITGTNATASTSSERHATNPQPRRSAAQPEGHIYAVIPNGVSDTGYYGTYASVNLTDGSLKPLYTDGIFSNGELYYLEAAAMRDGILYIPRFGENMITGETSIMWRSIDTRTGERLDDRHFSMSQPAFCYSLTYDPDKDLFYGLSVEMSTYGYGNLVVVDPNSDDWAPRVIANVGGTQGDFMACVAYCPVDQTLYGVKDNGTIYSIDADTGECYEVKTFEDYEEFATPTEYTTMPMVYSPRDHAFVSVVPNNKIQAMQLIYFDLDDNFSVVEGEVIDAGNYISALICTDLYAEDTTPDMPEITSLKFDGPSLTGSVSFTAPVATFDGTPLTAPVTLNVDVDGTTLHTQKIAPGASASASITVAEGQHEMRVYACGDDNKPGVYDKRIFYAGYDAPMPPTNVTLYDYTLMWIPPKGSQYGGYTDLSQLSYDIFIDDVKVNAEPVRDSYAYIDLTGDMRRAKITVTATSNERTSVPSNAIYEVIGTPLDLPAQFAPTREEMDLLRVFNMNHDENAFGFYTDRNGYSYVAVRSAQYYQTPDDWVILPAMSFPSSDKQYTLSFLYSNYYGSNDHMDDLDVCIGTYPDPSEMHTVVYSHSGLQTPTDTPVEINFGIPSEGVWYIGFHAKDPEGKMKYRGIKIRDIKVALDEASSAFAPATAEDVVVAAAPLGELRAIFDFTAPTLAINGTELDPEADIIYTLTSGTESATATVRPGKKCHMEIEVANNGDNKFFLTPSIDGVGKGTAASFNAYIGMDAPSKPTDLTYATTTDNLGLTLSWKAPEAGQHGTYLDPESIEYVVYRYANFTYTPVGSTKDLTYTYLPEPGKQAAVTLCVTARNSFGESYGDNPFATEYIGYPHDLPMIEHFGTVSLDYSPWRFNTEAPYDRCTWSNVSNLNGQGLGDPVFAMGGLECINAEGRGGQGELITPKISTKGFEKVIFDLKYWDYSYAASMELWGRTGDNTDYRLIASCTPSRKGAQWADWTVSLPEDFCNCGWAQFRLRATLTNNSSSRCVIDDLSFLIDAANDFKVSSLSGPQSVMVGETATFNVSIMNSGLDMGTTTLNVAVVGDGNELTSQTIAVGRTEAGNSFERNVEFPILVEYLSYNDIMIRASVASDLDEVPSNNTRTLPISICDNMLPIVTDLQGQWNNGETEAELSWSKPDTSYGDFDSFENIPAFGNPETIGQWRNVDRDGLIPFKIGGLRWEGDDAPGAWVVFDAASLGVMHDTRLRPHSGTQYLLARSIEYNESDAPVQSSDWLISPEVVGGTTVSFWMNTLDASDYKETIGIWVSNTDNDVESFRMQQVFTKYGDDGWEPISFKLPADAKYFAFEYRSWGQFGAMIDDVEFTPAQLMEWDIVHYNVYRREGANNASTLLAESVASTSYVDKSASTMSSYLYNVTTVTRDADGTLHESPFSNGVDIIGTGVDYVSSSLRIAGGRGVIAVADADTDAAAVYTVDGKYMASFSIWGGYGSIAIEPGVYIVKVGNTVAKVVVK